MSDENVNDGAAAATTEQAAAAETVATEPIAAAAPPAQPGCAPGQSGHVLLRRWHDVSAFASSDPSRYVLNGVHVDVELGCVEASDGRILMRAPLERDAAKDFPPLGAGVVELGANSIVPIKAWQAAMRRIPKAHLPILESVVLSQPVDGEGKPEMDAVPAEPVRKVCLTTNDLDCQQDAKIKVVAGAFPHTSQVIPTDAPTLRIAFDPELLGRICAYATKHSPEGKAAITLEFTDNLSPMRAWINLPEGRRAYAVLMPMRLV